MLSTQPLTTQQQEALANKVINPAWLGMVFNQVCNTGGVNIESEETLKAHILHTARVALLTEQLLREESKQ